MLNWFEKHKFAIFILSVIVIALFIGIIFSGEVENPRNLGHLVALFIIIFLITAFIVRFLIQKRNK